MTIDEPGVPARMRISDADRDTVAAILGDALAEGRITGEEHSDRLSAVYAAKTAADLAPLVADLPGAAEAMAALTERPAPAPADRATMPAGRMSWLVSVFSGTQKRGAWQVPARVTSVNVFGGSDLDLRDAVLPGRAISMHVICVFGGASIVVPPEMRVVDSGIALFGGRSMPGEDAAVDQPDSPVLYVRSICVFGGLDITRKRRKGDQKPRRDPAGGDLPDGWPVVRIRRSGPRRELPSARRTARRSARRRRPS